MGGTAKTAAGERSGRAREEVMRRAVAEGRAARLVEARDLSHDRESAATQWFALYVNPLAELRIELALIEAGLCAYVPEGTKWVKPRRGHKREPRLFRAFPRYVFAGLRDWRGFDAVRGVEGVRAVIGQAGAPSRLTSKAIADYRAAQDMGAFDVDAPSETPKPGRYQPGDVVMIIAGPFEGMTAVVRRASTTGGVHVEIAKFRCGLAHVALDRLKAAA